MADARKRWSYLAGQPGRNWVRAFEEARSSILYLEWYEEDPGGKRRRVRRSLGHTDRVRARDTADELAAAFLLRERPSMILGGDGITLGQLFDIYLREETPHKGGSKQAHDRRASGLFLQFFGRNFRVARMNRGHWVGFIRARRQYEVAPEQTLRKIRGRTERGEEVLPLGDRVIEYDLKFLWAVLNWAVEGTQDGVQLLERHPLKGVVRRRDWPRELNPERPRLSDEQYRDLEEVARTMDWRFHTALVLAHETGHRIGSIRQLRWGDTIAIDMLNWRKEGDKIGMEHQTPLTHPAIRALQRAREMNPGGEWIFPHPHPDHAGEPCSRHVMRTWWRQAQEAAGLGHLRRLGWHTLRRKFANDLRAVPLKDLAQLGGWKDVTTLLTCYLAEDMDAMRQALRMRRGYGDPGAEGSRQYA